MYFKFHICVLLIGSRHSVRARIREKQTHKKVCVSEIYTYNVDTYIFKPLILFKIWCPGANLKLRSLCGSRKIIRFSMVGKFLINPFGVVFTALAFNADPLLIQVILIFAALPTGVATFTLAREMQGDQPLMAAIITMQTLLSFIMLALKLLLGQVAFCVN